MIGLKYIALIMGAVMLSGCITFKHPKGDWAYPVDLRLEAGVLKNAVIGVRCGSGEADEDSWTESVMEGCMQTALAVRSLGAIVVADEALFPVALLEKKDIQKVETTGAKSIDNLTEQKDEEEGFVDVKKTKLKPSMTVVYIDRDTKRDRCGWTLPFFILYIGFFPCVEDVTSRAELRIYDERNIPMFQKNLVLDLRTIYGVPALYYLLMRWKGGREYKADRDALADNLYQFIQNTVHAQQMRIQVATGGSRG